MQLLIEEYKELVELQLIQEDVATKVRYLVGKFQKIVSNAFKTKNPKDIQRVDKIGKAAVTKVMKNERKISTALQSTIAEMGEVPHEKEESGVVMKAIKTLFIGVPKLLGLSISLLNPISWLSLYIVKSIAVKEKITIGEAWRRLFNFTLDQIKYKWPHEYKVMFLEQLALSTIGQILPLAGVLLFPPIGVVLYVLCYIAMIYIAFKMFIFELNYKG